MILAGFFVDGPKTIISDSSSVAVSNSKWKIQLDVSVLVTFYLLLECVFDECFSNVNCMLRGARGVVIRSEPLSQNETLLPG